MLNKFIFQVFIGGVIFFIGACLHDFSDMREIGDFLAYGGIAYAAIAGVLTLLGANLPTLVEDNGSSSFFSKVKNRVVSKNARAELLEYKKLLDAGVINQKEFDVKASELKKLFL